MGTLGLKGASTGQSVLAEIGHLSNQNRPLTKLVWRNLSPSLPLNPERFNMTRAEEFRVHARFCATAARFMRSDSAKREFEKQARGWQKMAERAEKDQRRAKVKAKVIN
jgi:hypothetical protein